MKKKIVSFVLSFLLVSTVMLPVFAASTSDLSNQKAAIQEKINETNAQKKEVKAELSAQMKEISNLDASIADLNAQITDLNNKISALEESIKESQIQLEKKQDEHEKNKKLMEERLVVMYESGETTFLDMLFSSKNIVEFISSYYMLSQITQCDQELLATIEKEQEEIKASKEKLENEKTELASSKTEKETKNNLLKTQRAQREEKASALSAEEKSLQGQIDSYNKEVDKIEAQIQEALRAAASKTGQGAAGLKFDGSFIWPCNNKIVTSTVKTRWGRMHKGIDIGANYENVYASASGYAYTLTNPGGYGYYIIVVHGGGYISLYGHLSAYKVSYGQYVSQGQVIATSGNSGSSTGAHLHFEIRKASSLSNYFSVSPLNPLDYLPGGYTLASGASTPS